MAVLGLNLKLVLYLQSQCFAKSLSFLDPPLLQAAARLSTVVKLFTIPQKTY